MQALLLSLSLKESWCSFLHNRYLPGHKSLQKCTNAQANPGCWQTNRKAEQRRKDEHGLHELSNKQAVVSAGCTRCWLLRAAVLEHESGHLASYSALKAGSSLQACRPSSSLGRGSTAIVYGLQALPAYGCRATGEHVQMHNPVTSDLVTELPAHLK